MSESAPPTVSMFQEPAPEARADSPQGSERARAIAAGQVRYLYDHASYGFFATVVTALMVVAVEWRVADHARLLWWAAYMGTLTAIRLSWLLRFRRVSAAQTNLQGWGTLFVAGAALAGLGWGSSSPLLFPETSTPHQMFLLLILCAMTAGAIPVLSGRMTAYLAFLIPSLSPAILRFFLQGDVDATLMGAMGLVFMGAMAFGAWKMHITILEALTFRYDNLDLATKLTWEVVERKQAEAALRTSHERFELAAEGSREGLWDVEVPDVPSEQWFRPDRPIYYSPRFKALLGFTEEEFPNVLGSWESRLHPDDRARVLDAALAHLLGQGPYEVDYRLRAKSGEYRWYVSRGQAIWNDARRPIRMAGSFSDITERKRVEEGLREATARLLKQQTALIELIRSQSREPKDLPTLIQQVTWVVGHTLGVQRVGLWRLTDNGQRLICLDLYELESDRHSSGAELRAGDYPDYLKTLGGDRIIVADDVRRDPRTSELSAEYLVPFGITSMMDVPLHVHGKLRGILCHEHVGPARSWTIDEQLFALAASNLIALAKEQVERAKVEEELRASQAQYRLLVDQAHDIIYRTDAQGYLRLINPTTVRLTQYAEHELLGHRFIEFIRPDARPAAERFYGRQFVRKTPSTYYEYPLIRKDGSEIWIGQNVQVLLEEDQVVGFQAVARDLTERKRMEDALRASQAQYRLLVDTATDIIYRTDAQGRFTIVNPPAIRITQFEERQLLGLRFVELIRPDARAAAERFYGRQFVRKIPTTYYEYPIVRKDGQEVWIGQNVQVLLEEGQVVGFQAVARDITERKQAEAALKEQMRLSMLAAEVNGALVQRASLRAMLQSCAEALVNHLDAVFARIWLLGPGDLCGDCYMAAHCADRTRCLHLEASAGLSRNLNGEYRRIPLGALKIGTIAQGQGPMVTNDVLNDDRLPNKDWMKQNGLRSFAGYPLLLEGQVMGVMAVFARHPLTESEVSAMETVSRALTLGIERKKAEEALQDSEQRLELALRGGDLGAWDWQVQTGAAVFNRRWAEMLDYTLDELMPHVSTWERLVHPEDLPQLREALQAHLDDRTPSFEAELRMKTKGGEWRWILARGRVVSRDAQGIPVRATGTHLDITDRKRAEAEVKERSRQLEAANKELEAFSYSVSHDLRAPLRHIDGFAELLDKHATPLLDEKGHKYLRAISDSAQRMGRLIDDLLEFSRTGRAELHTRVVPLEALVRSVIDDLQPETEGRTIDWTIGSLPKVLGDPALLRQVWFNLVANAIKYTRPRARHDRDRPRAQRGRPRGSGIHPR